MLRPTCSAYRIKKEKGRLEGESKGEHIHHYVAFLSHVVVLDKYVSIISTYVHEQRDFKENQTNYRDAIMELHMERKMRLYAINSLKMA